MSAISSIRALRQEIEGHREARPLSILLEEAVVEAVAAGTMAGTSLEAGRDRDGDPSDRPETQAQAMPALPALARLRERHELLKRIVDIAMEDYPIPVHTRGIGSDSTPGCFVCGGPKDLYSNVSFFVESKEDGEHAVSLFKQGARLDWRAQEPQWIQVKIGACKLHLPNLELLRMIVLGTKVLRKNVVETAFHYNHEKWCKQTGQ